MKEKKGSEAATFSRKLIKVGHNGGHLGEEPVSVWGFFWFFFLNAGDLTWFLVCCCALSLPLGCRGVSLGMGPIGVGCKKHEETSAVKIKESFLEEKKQ